MARAYQFDTQLGIDDDNVDNAMFVYPNPTSGKFKVTGITGRIEIFNPVGQLIYSRVVLRTEATIDLSDQANGSYILKVIDEKHSFSEMFFIQK